MATKVKSEGKCRLCGKKFSKGSMANHLRSCREKSTAKWDTKTQRKTRTFHIVVEGSPYHWLHVEASAEVTLADLDNLLRRIWLECCGHCSDFEIEGTRYSGASDMGWSEFDDESMDKRLGNVLRKGMKFRHTYDYGTTTECQLRVVSEGAAPVKKRSVQILARNEPLDIPCVECGKPAKYVCTECMWDGEGWLCDDCLDEHECGDEMALPAVNSPRAGMCGYTGGDEEDEF